MDKRLTIAGDGESAQSRELAAVNRATLARDSARTPTLMAAAHPGSQGEVRVWKPSRPLLWISLVGSGAALALFVFSLIHDLAHLQGGLLLQDVVCTVICCIWIAGNLKFLRRPCFVVTDSAGVAIASVGVSRALLWSDIRTVQWRAGHSESAPARSIRLELKEKESADNSAHLTVELGGYSRKSRWELCELVRKQVERHRWAEDNAISMPWFRSLGSENVKAELPDPRDRSNPGIEATDDA